MRLGINTMAWDAEVGPETLARFAGLRAMGYDAVELPVLTPATMDAPTVRSAADAAGLTLTASTALPAGASLIDPAESAAGLAFLRDCLEICGAIGARVLCGPLHTPVGQHRHAPTTTERERCVTALRELAGDAERLGVVLAVEPLNRFETGFLNTLADGVELVRRVGHASVGLLADTFHQNIEERDPVAALRSALPWVRHVHFSGNDRGPVGTGHIPWQEIADVLVGGGYDGIVTFETFAGHIPQLAEATAIWRSLHPSPEDYARTSIAATRPWFPVDPDLPVA